MSEYFQGVFAAIIKAPFAIAMLFTDVSVATKLGILTIWPGAIFAWIAYAGIMGAAG